ncbi:His Kinase A (phospho-acceptor) domain-containing protein [Butyrivibrio sp. Su6]|uniref:sensor histidine kinase n=1 Tax=Butyrivibrio sp. Su6 TaxID=1520810 RepID=UPI00089F541A|nr:HAMP domain-containing sensor histidine kinase [Butyrivibrio sp. Su6]SEG25850.1 His Kinase A (phospho-acceptor) domain-containing protein [Butyrivibrio sp. Su6]
MDVKKKFEQPKISADLVDELSQKLLAANNELKRVEEERTMMLENISHDLRAPLTAIRNTIDFIKDNRNCDVKDMSKDEFKNMINLLDSRTKSLEVLIGDLYYLTCLDSKKDEFDFCEIPIGQFLEEYYFALEIDDTYKDYKLVMEVPENMKEIVMIDGAKMIRVLDNLFTNARKYSDAGSVIALGAGKKDGEVFFYVQDNGRGIPEELIPYVFDRTFRVSKDRSPKGESSNGLGLAIAKSIVNGHGGRIECKSTFGKGSKFIVYLPEQ